MAPPKPLYDVETNKCIARKLGITWGSDWPSSIDRPHFEVKSNWKMPRGYKLEGQLLVPSKRKLTWQIQFGILGSPAMRTETENFITQAVKDGIIRALHLKDLQSGIMTTDRLIGLYITIQQRRSK